MDRTDSPGEFPPGRSKYLKVFFILEMNEKNSIQLFSKNEILLTFSTIDSRSASLSNRYSSSDLIKE